MISREGERNASDDALRGWTGTESKLGGPGKPQGGAVLDPSLEGVEELARGRGSRQESPRTGEGSVRGGGRALSGTPRKLWREAPLQQMGNMIGGVF